MSDKKYFWTAYLDNSEVLSEENGNTLEQVEERRSEAELIYIDLNDGSFAYGFDFVKKRFGIEGTWFSLSHDVQKFTDFVPVVEREGSVYMVGFEAKRPDKSSIRQVIYVS